MNNITRFDILQVRDNPAAPYSWLIVLNQSTHAKILGQCNQAPLQFVERVPKPTGTLQESQNYV